MRVFVAHCSNSILCTDTHNRNDSVETMTKIHKMEKRLTNLESKVSMFPNEFDKRIDARLDAFERRQEQRLSDEMEKIMRMLVDKKK